MKKIFIILCFILLLSGCKINNSISSTYNDPSDYSPSSSAQSEPSDTSSEVEFSALGRFVCVSDYHLTEEMLKYPEFIPAITFYEDGTCNLFVAYFHGTCNVKGVYSKDGSHVKVELDLRGTLFEGTDQAGFPYMNDKYIFTIVSDERIIIDKGFYSVDAGDPFVKSSSIQ